MTSCYIIFMLNEGAGFNCKYVTFEINLLIVTLCIGIRCL